MELAPPDYFSDREAYIYAVTWPTKVNLILSCPGNNWSPLAAKGIAKENVNHHDFRTAGLNQTSIKLCFLTKDEVALTWENRHQNYSVVSVCEALRYNPKGVGLMLSLSDKI